MTNLNEIQKHLDKLSEYAQATEVTNEEGTEITVKDLQEVMRNELLAIEELQSESREKDLALDEIALTSDELKKLGERLTREYQSLRVMASAIENMQPAEELFSNDKNQLIVKYDNVYRLNSTMFDEIETVIKTLDDAAHLLIENANEKEINYARKNLTN